MGSDHFTFRQWMSYRESALTIARVGSWRLYPGIARIEVSPKWKELFGDGGDGGEPRTLREYLRLIDPDDWERVTAETTRAFLFDSTGYWQSIFRRGGRVILARAAALSPGHVIGVDIDVS